MENATLKKSILEIVDNQIEANDPPYTRETYETLVKVGYSQAEAKEKIGAVVLAEIYDKLKEGQPFDEKAYQYSLEDMLWQCLDDGEDDIFIKWDKWDELVENGYDAFEAKRGEEGLRFWQEAWELIESLKEDVPEAETLYDLMESQNYVYAVDTWLQNYEKELRNAGYFGERIALCQKVLDVFDWREYDDSCFRCGIGDSLFRQGKIKDAYEYYENWLREHPRNVDGINSFSWFLFENGEAEKAYELVKKATQGISCYGDDAILFMRARQLAEELGKEEDIRWFQRHLDAFSKLLGQREVKEDDRFDEFTMPKQIQVIKGKKTYPNDPCPCGSGKKYKKCCGKA